MLNGGSLSRVAGENVGVYGYQGNNLTITKALLNVIADAKTKVYGDADPSLTYQVTWLARMSACTASTRVDWACSARTTT